MRIITITAAALLTACAAQPNANNPFANPEDFAAQREVEAIVIEDLDRDSACVHVTEVLMDLDCDLVDINSQLGLFAGKTRFRRVQAEGFFNPATFWRGCGGSNVTVTVKEKNDTDVMIRAAFEPTSPEANQAFDTLLRRSIDQQRKK